MLGALAAVWGAAFMLIEIGLRGFEPTSLIFIRLASAAVTLALVELARGRLPATLRRLRPHARRLAFSGIVGVAAPFFLIAWGQQYVDSNVAAILNAAAPLFTVLIAALAVHSERVAGSAARGLHHRLRRRRPRRRRRPGRGRTQHRRRARDRRRHGVLRGRRAVHRAAAAEPDAVRGLARLARLGRARDRAGGHRGAPGQRRRLGPGRRRPSRSASSRTAFAFQLYYGLIAGVGASRAILVTYLVPALALVYGILLLDEELRWTAVAGLALVLTGVAFGTGAARLRRRREPLPA